MNVKTSALLAILERARTALSHDITYKMGHGGNYPGHPLPTDDQECDCSGFVAWCLSLGRAPKHGRTWWIETTAVWEDATGKQTVFVKIPHPVPGCCVVYPDHEGHQGHIGIVANPALPYTVVDCSASKDGIAEHLQTAFAKNPKTVFCVLRRFALGGSRGYSRRSHRRRVVDLELRPRRAVHRRRLTPGE